MHCRYCWETWTRTKIDGTRTHSFAIKLSPNALNIIANSARNCQVNISTWVHFKLGAKGYNRDITDEEQGECPMSTHCDDLKKRLQERVYEAMETLLEQKGGRRDLSMGEMEDLVGEFELQVRQSLMQEIVAEVQATQSGLCETCGGKLRYKGKKSKRVVTLRGEVTVERDYYQCESCGSGYFPPG